MKPKTEGSLPITGATRPAGRADSPFGLTNLDIAAGMPLGAVDRTAEWSEPQSDAISTLEAVVRSALLRPPCVVSFSGGMDSSTVLTVAAHVARRDGLAAPIPVSMRFPHAPLSDESAWQEMIVRRLGLDDWERLSLGHELEVVGPVARSVLSRHGLLWPPNTHLHVPVLALAPGGSMLTGIDGDGLFMHWRWAPLWRRLRRPWTLRPRHLLWLAHAATPPVAREIVIRRRHRSGNLPWLRPGARAEVDRLEIDLEANEPFRWGARTHWFARTRKLEGVVHAMAQIAKDFDCEPVHPFADPGFLGAIAHDGGLSGWKTRGAAMDHIAQRRVPREALGRRTKAVFDEVMWGQASRSFARQWNGEGIDSELVNPEPLRAMWQSGVTNVRAHTLLQQAWVRSQGPSDRSI